MRISQCMIVKDEETNIRQALEWGSGIVWEQIVVDTGSRDQTAALAASMGAKVFHYPWNDDFAAAKNFALEQAEGDWIAFLDADEYISARDAERLAGILEDVSSRDGEAVMVSVVNLETGGTVGSVGSQIRLFRNKPDLRYRRRIHEQLEAEGGKRELHLVDATETLSVFHTGYCGKALEQKKASGRNLRLIQKELEDHPGDPEILGYLGDEYHGMGMDREAVQSYRQAVEAMPETLDQRDARSAATFSGLLRILTAQKVPESQIEQVYQKGTSLLPMEADFAYIVGHYYASAGNYGRGGALLELALDKLAQGGTCNRSMGIQGDVEGVFQTLAICFYQQGDSQKAVQYSVAVLRQNRYSMTALVVLLRSLRGEGAAPATPAEQVADFLEKLYDRTSPKDKMVLLAAAQKLQWLRLEQQLEQRFG